MPHTPNFGVISFMSLLASLASLSRADEVADKGREIFKKNQRAVVTVQVVVKMKFSVPGMGGQANESKQDVTGTVVDPSGLTVLALSSCEPGDMIQSMMAGMSDEDTKFKMETELSDVKLLLDDGTEVGIDPASTEGSEVRYLRVGQRVDFDVAEEAGRQMARGLHIVTFA